MCKQACSTKTLLKPIVLFLATTSFVNLNCLFDLPNSGRVGTAVEVRIEIENYTTTMDPQHLGPGLRGAIERAIDHNRLHKYRLSWNDQQKIARRKQYRSNLVHYESAFAYIRDSMERFRQNRIRIGRWRMPPKIDETNKTLVSSDCCKQTFHQRCTNANFEVGNKKCPLCRNEDFKLINIDRAPEDKCCICLEEFDEKTQEVTMSQKRSYREALCESPRSERETKRIARQ